MNNWLSKRNRRIVFNKLKTCTCCLFNNHEESSYCDLDISMIWDFEPNFSWFGWRIYNSSSLFYEEFFDVEFKSDLNGSVQINLHDFIIKNINFGELYSEFN